LGVLEIRVWEEDLDFEVRVLRREIPVREEWAVVTEWDIFCRACCVGVDRSDVGLSVRVVPGWIEFGK